jgi:hypothetical protein
VSENVKFLSVATPLFAAAKTMILKYKLENKLVRKKIGYNRVYAQPQILVSNLGQVYENDM